MTHVKLRGKEFGEFVVNVKEAIKTDYTNIINERADTSSVTLSLLF